MTTYLFRCPGCRAGFESRRAVERLTVCPHPGCAGEPERVEGVAFHHHGDPSGAVFGW